MQTARSFMINSLLLTTLAFTPLSVRAESCSGGCTGGGHTIRSTEKEIEESLRNLKERMKEFTLLYGVRYQAFNPDYAQDPILREAFSRTKGVIKGDKESSPVSGWALLTEMETSPFLLKEFCKNSAGKKVTASTRFKSGAPVCVSKSDLRVLPPQEMRTQLWALAYHELMHHLQPAPHNREELRKYEREANAVQKFVFAKYGSYLPFDQKKLFMVQEREIFPGGYANIRIEKTQSDGTTKYEITQVFCGGENANDAPPVTVQGGATLLEPGMLAILSDGTRTPVGVTCLDLPKVKCTYEREVVEGSTQHRIMIGDFPYYRGTAFKGPEPQNAVRRLKNAGICDFQLEAPRQNFPQLDISESDSVNRE